MTVSVPSAVGPLPAVPRAHAATAWRRRVPLDAGASHFVDARSGQRVGAPMNRWQQRYTPETVAAQLQRAGAVRWRTRALERGLPLGLFAAGLLAAAAAWRLRRAT